MNFVTKTMVLLAVICIVSFGMAVNARGEWEGDVTVGANLQSGNTNNASISISGKASKKVGNDRYKGNVRFNYAEENNQPTAMNSYGAIQYDNFITGKLYALLNVELQKDKFRNLNLRTILSPGIGYQITEAVSVEGGLAYFSEDVDVGKDRQWTTARLGANLNQKLFSNIKFNNSLVVNTSLKEISQYKLRNEADLIAMLSEKWSAKLTHVFQYDSEPSASITKKDQTWILGLQYNF